MQESSELIRQKVENCLKAQVTPIICIGEDIAVRQNNNYKNFLLKQLGCVDKKFNEKEIKGEGCNNKGEVVVSS